MTETADPRIALMQKWSQENPELLAQAGLAASATGAFGNANDHFIAGGINKARMNLLEIAGVDPSKHAHPQSGHPHREAKAKKGKGKGKKNQNPNVHLTVAGVPITIGGHHPGKQEEHQHTKHKKKNPYMNVEHERLKTVYNLAQKNLVDAVSTAVSTVEAIYTNLPPQAKPVFANALQSIKTLRTRGAISSAYEISFEKISEVLAAYKSLATTLKYTLRKPHVIPSESIPGTASLLSKLINVTIAYLRAHTKNTEERKKFGLYEFRAQLYNMANAKENFTEINQALKHQESLKNTTQIPMNRPGTNGGAVVRANESAEHAFEPHGTFSMSSPYDT